MLGDQIAELKGKILSQRVLDLEGPTMETSVSVVGAFKGTQVQEHLTYIAKFVSPGILNGNGRGVIMAGESDMATYAAQAIGRLGPSGVRWCGSGFFRTSSTGKLAFLNNVVGLLETEVDAEGNFTEKIWEWK
jgi:hypothetical protein